MSKWISVDLLLMGMLIIALLIWILLSGCATKVGIGPNDGDVMLRQYPVPIKFTVAEGAHDNIQ